MGDRLATKDMVRKLGCVPLLGGGAGSPCNTMQPGPRPTFVLSGILSHPAVWSQYTWVDFFRMGGCAPWAVELGPHITQCCPGRGLPSYQVASWSIQPYSHNKHGPKIGGCDPFGGEGAESPFSTMWPGPRPTSIPSCVLIHAAVWSHRHGPKIGGSVLFLKRGRWVPI